MCLYHDEIFISFMYFKSVVKICEIINFYAYIFSWLSHKEIKEIILEIIINENLISTFNKIFRNYVFIIFLKSNKLLKFKSYML